MRRDKNYFSISFLLIGIILFFGLTYSGIAQNNNGNDTQEPIRFDISCANPDVIFRQNDVIQNNNFESDASDVGTTSGWTLINASLEQNPTTLSELQLVNNFIQLAPNGSIETTPSVDRTASRLFTLEICARIEGGGQLLVTIGNQPTITFPPGGNFSPILEGNFVERSIRIDLSFPTAAQNNRIEIFYTGNDEDEGVAFVDNIQLYPDGSGEEETTPTPTPPATPTPTNTPTPGPSLTPTPTLSPLEPTWTPTPALKAESLQMVANPPMLMVSPDDFVGAQSHKKMVELNLQVVGSNGQPVDILSIDPDATIEFEIQNRGDQINAGSLLEFFDQGEDTRQIRTEKIPLRDVVSQDDRIVFVPQKVFDGTVRIAATIEYDAITDGQEQQQEIRGTVPLVMRSTPGSSLTQTTGSFDPTSNQRAGRQPGDRGFRPDVRTNLYFRERLK